MLGLAITILVAGVIALGLYQVHKTGLSAWLRVPGTQEVKSSCAFHLAGTSGPCLWVLWL